MTASYKTQTYIQPPCSCQTDVRNTPVQHQSCTLLVASRLQQLSFDTILTVELSCKSIEVASLSFSYTANSRTLNSQEVRYQYGGIEVL